MPKKMITFTVAILALVLWVTAAFATPFSTPSTPISDNGIVPYILTQPGPGGNVTCAMLGYEQTSARANYDTATDSFDAAFPAGITVSVTNDTFIEWDSTFPIGAVIAKGSNDANVYEYIPPSLGDSGLASPVNSSGGSANLSNLTFCWNLPVEVSKTAETSYDRDWTWNIEKSGDQSELTLSVGQSFLVNYTVDISAEPTDSNWAVSGTISVFNPNVSAVAIIADVSDVITPGDVAANVDCGVVFPHSLGGGQTLQCTYSASAGLDGSETLNTATAVMSSESKVAGDSGTADVSYGDPTNETDECVNVSDSLVNGAGGQVCAPGTTLYYSYTVGPYAECGDDTVSNTASFTTNDTGTTGESSWDVAVSVPCAGGCTLTQGYWKTHSEFGPAPYDDTWAQLANGASTPFFLSGQTYYEVLWTPPAGNAYYVLAHQYIAAQLNFLNGADPSAAQAAFNSATTLFNTYTPAQVAGLKGNAKKAWTDAAGTLDNYNNGLIGPGHCSEEGIPASSGLLSGLSKEMVAPLPVAKGS